MRQSSFWAYFFSVNERIRHFDLKKNFIVFFGMHGSVHILKNMLRVTGRFNNDLHQWMNSSFLTSLIKFRLTTHYSPETRIIN